MIVHMHLWRPAPLAGAVGAREVEGEREVEVEGEGEGVIG
jgi:hypothetical protein